MSHLPKHPSDPENVLLWQLRLAQMRDLRASTLAIRRQLIWNIIGIEARQAVGALSPSLNPSVSTVSKRHL